MYIKKGDSCRHYIWFVGEGVLLVMMTTGSVLVYVLLFFVMMTIETVFVCHSDMFIALSLCIDLGSPQNPVRCRNIYKVLSNLGFFEDNLTCVRYGR